MVSVDDLQASKQEELTNCISPFLSMMKIKKLHYPFLASIGLYGSRLKKVDYLQYSSQ
ncbi:hypothetical protein [Carboxylicivirga sp. RSCT41]|uniref:hypothetical protein n=1 Tax=Carboxylicivirga agarovorans TaxID=3417570 RepID=UPI003D3417A1